MKPAPAGTCPKIQLTGIHKSFGSKHVLKGIDLAVEDKKSMVIIGGSGSGKSITLKCILGLMIPDSGSILLDGKETVGLKPKDRADFMHKFGMLFQGAALFDSLPVWENVAFALLHAKKMDRTNARKIAIEKLDRVGLAKQSADLYPAELSGGMQKRVGLARAIAANPKIIFFDEPTTGLDPIMADVINDLIVENVRELGATTLTITHDMSSVRKIADQVAMIYEGQIIWAGSKSEMDKSSNDYVDQFIHGRSTGPIRKHAGFTE